MKTNDVWSAVEALKRAIDADARESIRDELRAVLGNKTVVLNSVIRGNLLIPGQDFDGEAALEALRGVPGFMPNAEVRSVKNGHVAPKSLRPRRSAASLARQAASMRRVWKAKRKAARK